MLKKPKRRANHTTISEDHISSSSHPPTKKVKLNSQQQINSHMPQTRQAKVVKIKFQLYLEILNLDESIGSKRKANEPFSGPMEKSRKLNMSSTSKHEGDDRTVSTGESTGEKFTPNQDKRETIEETSEGKNEESKKTSVKGIPEVIEVLSSDEELVEEPPVDSKVKALDSNRKELLKRAILAKMSKQSQVSSDESDESDDSDETGSDSSSDDVTVQHISLKKREKRIFKRRNNNIKDPNAEQVPLQLPLPNPKEEQPVTQTCLMEKLLAADETDEQNL